MKPQAAESEASKHRKSLCELPLCKSAARKGARTATEFTALQGGVKHGSRIGGQALRRQPLPGSTWDAGSARLIVASGGLPCC
jgi:hypothetical protein